MNKVVILLSAICVALLAALVMRSQRAAALLESAGKETLTVSNQLSEATIKLEHQERMNAVLKSQLAGRDTALAALSNGLAQVRATLATIRAELEAARAEIPPAIARGNAFAAERDGFSNRVNEAAVALREQERVAREARERTVAVQSELAALSHRLAEDQAERARLENLLTDPAALQARLADVHRMAAVTEKTRPSTKSDFHQPLQLQPDGTVVLVPPQKSPAN